MAWIAITNLLLSSGRLHFYKYAILTKACDDNSVLSLVYILDLYIVHIYGNLPT